MSVTRGDRTIEPTGRSSFLRARRVVLLGAVFLLVVSRGEPAPNECHARGAKHADCGVHNMMVVGESTIFLSHLPMFESEHRFQVILEATFARAGKSVSEVYADDRRGHRDVRMYTLALRDVFVLARLFGTDPPPRRSFRGTVFRGHLERGGERLDGLTDIEVTVKRVVYREEIGGASGIIKSDKLDYVLFGSGSELFLAHRIAQPPDFDQIVGVKVSGHTFADTELERGVSVKILDRENTPDRRLRAGDRVAAQGHVTGAHMFLPLQVEVAAELYFEEGELASPVTFDQTPLEKAAGF